MTSLTLTPMLPLDVISCAYLSGIGLKPARVMLSGFGQFLPVQMVARKAGGEARQF
jgi:hypothetical protein